MYKTKIDKLVKYLFYSKENGIRIDKLRKAFEW